MCVVPPDRARRASRRDRDRAWRYRVDQDRGGSRRRRSCRLSPVRGASARRHHRRCRRARGSCGTERAAEDAGRDAVRVDLRAGVVDTGRASADGAIAMSRVSDSEPLSAAEVAQALVRDHRYSEADARAAAADADGSVGRALAADSADLTEAERRCAPPAGADRADRGSGASARGGQGSQWHQGHVGERPRSDGGLPASARLVAARPRDRCDAMPTGARWPTAISSRSSRS